MMQVLRKWVDRYFAEEEAVILLVLMVLGLILLATMGDVLAPVIASVVLAFMMQGVVGQLTRRGVNEHVALGFAFALFIGVFLLFLLILLPLVWNQLRTLVGDLPGIIDSVRDTLLLLPQKYPSLINEQQSRELIESSSRDIARMGQTIFSFSLTHLPGILGLGIYLIIVPILVFFFLKDRAAIINWCAALLPAKRPQMSRIWHEMDMQLANYVRGKGVEILIVGATSMITFALFGLSYAVLLGFLVGLSVVIPYVGAALVTVPVALVAYFQWGWSPLFGYLMAAYLLIQILDGNVLVPLLFSEANSLHPIAIILAVLLFGSIWGVWGAFFAIPLATLVKATMHAWPRSEAGVVKPPTDAAV
jgi:putative permease